MTSLLNRLLGRAKKGSGATAKNRLHFVLQHDRINLPPQRMEEMKREILAVIVKYLVVDQERVEIALEQRDRAHSKLVAEIPFAKEKQVQIDLQPESAAGDSSSADANGAGKTSVETNDDDLPDEVSSDSGGAKPVPAVDKTAETGADDESKHDKKK